MAPASSLDLNFSERLKVDRENRWITMIQNASKEDEAHSGIGWVPVSLLAGNGAPNREVSLFCTWDKSI